MPRQDINVDTTYGELNTTDNLTNKAVHPFVLLEEHSGPYGNEATYGEIVLPAGFMARYSDANGFHTHIEYRGIPQPLYLRLGMDNPGGDIEYIPNSVSMNHWFPVCEERESGEPVHILLSELRRYGESENFRLLIKPGYLALYCGDETDVTITPAMKQNEVFLLKAFAGNLYQHPTTGVGLIEFLHGNFENTGLAAKLQSEFENDKMVINDAYMNSETGELYLDVREKNG